MTCIKNGFCSASSHASIPSGMTTNGIEGAIRRMYRSNNIEASERDINVSEDVVCIACKLSCGETTADVVSVEG
jgi:hypothetical protein